MPMFFRTFLSAMVATLSLGALEAQANPHVWVETGIAFKMESDAVTGLAFAWRFDDYFSAHAIRSHDLDRNGVLEPAEVESLRASSFDPLVQFDYHVHVWARGTKLDGHVVDQFAARIADGRLIYEFSIPVSPPIDPGINSVVVSVFDGENAVDFRFSESGFLTVSGEPRADCRFRVARGSGDQAGHAQTATFECAG